MNIRKMMASFCIREIRMAQLNKARSNKIARQFDPRWPELISNPYPVYQHYREAEPIHWGISPDPRFPGAWYVFDYAEASSVLRDSRFDNDMRKYLPVVPQPAGDPIRLSAMDPPEHTRLRAVIMEAFTSRRTEPLRTRVLAVIDSQLQRIEGREQFDLVEDYAIAVPIAMIADLLGVPEVDREMLRRLADVVMLGYDIGGDLDQVRSAAEAVNDFAAYFNRLIRLRKETDQADDLIQHLIKAVGENRLTLGEIAEICRFMTIAGFETTLNLIGTGIYHLMCDPQQLAVIRTDVSATISDATDELLRIVSPVQRVDRYAREDIEIGGRIIEKGESVRVLLGAANHDPRQFSDPERLDVKRKSERNLAFGFGRHLCSGAGLARMEAQEAIAAFVTRFPDAILDPLRPPKWRPMQMTRGLASLPIVRRRA
jgi:cytochrome P450